MAKAESRLPSEDPSVEHVARKLVDRLQANQAGGPSRQPSKQAEPERREPGVYFGLPAANYHADPSLGSSDIKRLLQAPPAFWHHSWMNPARPASPDSAAKLKGRALHALVLQGEKAFAEAFAIAPSREDYPNALVTLDDLKAKLRTLCEPTSGTKDMLAKRIRLKLPDVVIFDDVLKIFRAVAERGKLEILSKEAACEVRKAAAAITSNPPLARAFTGGVPEVSVFWEEDGVPLKARLDYLKPRCVIDLKGIANQRERPVDVAIRLAIAEYRYDIQARHYCDAYQALHTLAAQGRIFGDCPLNKGWHKRIVPPVDLRWTWIFHQTDGTLISKGRELSPLSPVLNKATREIAQAKASYRACLKLFGTDPWADREPVREFTEDELVSWLLEGAEVL
jgi:hypothetical protein